MDNAPDKRAGYHIPVNHFSEAPAQARGHAFDTGGLGIAPGRQHGNSREVLLDLAPAMGLPFAATTPNMLASYLVLTGTGPLDLHPRALAGIHYVVDGQGTSTAAGHTVRWSSGDLLVLPCDGPVRHVSESPEGALLFCTTDAPLWRYLGVQSLEAGRVARRPVHYPAAAIAAQMERLDALAANAQAVGRAVIFTRTDQPGTHLTTPFFISNINTLEAGDDQRTHRHNGAAITLSIQGRGCHSLVGDERFDWTPLGVMVTPSGAPHSHHNRGNRTMVSLVVQDSGFYAHAGVQGFAFDPEADRRWAQAIHVRNGGIAPSPVAPAPSAP